MTVLRVLIIVLVFSVVVVAIPVQDSQAATIFEFKWGVTEIMMEFGLFYMPLGWYIPLTGKEIPVKNFKTEFGMYWHMFINALFPRFIVLEGSINPLPLLGVGLREWSPKLYKKAELAEGFNIIESLTTSNFREPWAVSFFLGNIIHFTTDKSRKADRKLLSAKSSYDTNCQPGADKKVSGKGYSGLVFSYGNRHINNNLLIKDEWLEMEAKIKGKWSKGSVDMSWSYRYGVKLHSNENIKDYMYGGFKRDHNDFNCRKFSFLKNSYIDLKASMDLDEFKFLGMEAIFGKKFPSKNSKVLFLMSIGVAYFFNSRYKDELIKIGDEFSLWITPNIIF